MVTEDSNFLAPADDDDGESDYASTKKGAKESQIRNRQAAALNQVTKLQNERLDLIRSTNDCVCIAQLPTPNSTGMLTSEVVCSVSDLNDSNNNDDVIA